MSGSLLRGTYSEGWRKMKERLIRFMQGRYGIDQLSKFLIILGVAAVFVSAVFFFFFAGLLFYFLGWALVIWGYFRVFSRNMSKRRAENEAFLAKTGGVRRFFEKQKYMWRQRKVYHIYKCPGCGQKIRIPKGKGKIEVRCPKCNTTFIKKS